MKSRVFITDSFKKQLGERKLFGLLFAEIRKHGGGSHNMVDLYSPARDFKVYKAYLDSKRWRSAILLQMSKKIYMPLFITKKESKEGRNLSKYSEDFLFSKIVKVQEDIRNKRYTEYEV